MSELYSFSNSWKPSGGAIAGAVVGGIGGLVAGKIMDYLKHNRELYHNAKLAKDRYIELHKDDYTDEECRAEATVYIDKKQRDIYELKQKLSVKMDKYVELSNATKFSNLSPSLMKNNINTTKWYIVKNDVSNLKITIDRCYKQIDDMKRNIITGNWGAVRQYLVYNDAEKYAAQYVKAGLQNTNTKLGVLSGLSLGAIGGMLMCLGK